MREQAANHTAVWKQQLQMQRTRHRADKERLRLLEEHARGGAGKSEP